MTDADDDDHSDDGVDVEDAIESAIRSKISSINLSIDELISMATGGGGGGGGGNGILPQFDSGAHIKSDGLAMLHKNEMVVPAADAAPYRGEAAPGGDTYNEFHIDARGADDPAAVRRASREGLRDALSSYGMPD